MLSFRTSALQGGEHVSSTPSVPEPTTAARPRPRPCSRSMPAALARSRIRDPADLSVAAFPDALATAQTAEWLQLLCQTP